MEIEQDERENKKTRNKMLRGKRVHSDDCSDRYAGIEQFQVEQHERFAFSNPFQQLHIINYVQHIIIVVNIIIVLVVIIKHLDR